MPQGSDIHQKKVLEEKRQRWNQDILEKKLDLILLRLDGLEKRVAELAEVAGLENRKNTPPRSGKNASPLQAKKR